MDASNPVQDSTRVTIAQIRERKQKYLRQDLGWLDLVTANLKRIRLEELPRRVTAVEDTEVVKAKLASIRKKHGALLDEYNNYDLISPEQLQSFLEVRPPVPVCGLQNDSMPLHPVGKFVEGGKVYQNLSFGSVGIDAPVVEMLAAHLETTEFIDFLGRVPIYTKGTAAGLRNRLEMQLSRKCVPINISQKGFELIMSKALPVKTDELMDWNSDLYDLFENVETSFSSSGGAPYFRRKEDCVDDMLDVVLPMVAQALQNGTLSDLKKQQPELFLAVVKNKDDRYAKPGEKTRPYLSLPWHFQTLFSVLCQKFCKGLMVFNERKGCRNAYGFSYANGGGNALWEFMQGTVSGEPRYIVYGDDVDLYVRDGDHKLYRYCPDFSQMDGSVDRETVRKTIDWIYNTYARKFGENQFWKNVCEVWKEMSLDPDFLIQGTTVYKKKVPDGIMSGVVGTTLFDTVKAVMAYEEFVNIFRFKSHMDNEVEVHKFFRDRGLIIKEGTFEPHLVPKHPNIGEPVTPQKFLGMQLMPMRHNDTTIFVPTMPFDDWMQSLVTPRERVAHTRFGNQRYLFDRLRGLLTTGGSFDERFRKVCNTMLRNIPGSAIIMDVTMGSGKGAKPELIKVVGEEFEYTNASGWPTEEWCLNLYAPPEHKLDLELVPIFEDPDEVLKKLPARKPIMPVAAIVDIKQGGEIVSSTVAPVEPENPVVVIPDITSGMQTSVALSSKDCKEALETKPLKKSPEKNFLPTSGELVDQKKLSVIQQIQRLIDGPATDADDVRQAFDDLAGHAIRIRDKGKGLDCVADMIKNNKWNLAEYTVLGMVLDGFSGEDIGRYTVELSRIVTMDYLCHKTGQARLFLALLCRAHGLYVYGPPSCQYVSKVPIAPLDPLYRKNLQTQMEANKKELLKVKDDLKNKPISENTSKILQKKRDIAQVVERASERPAMLPSQIYVKPPPVTTTWRFKAVPGVDARKAIKGSKIDQQIACAKILKKNEVTYRVERVPDGSSNFYWKKGDVENLEYTAKPPGNLFVKYYVHLLSKYISDVEPNAPELSKPGENWYDLYKMEKNVRVRLLLEQGRPLVFSIKGWKDVVADKTSGLEVKGGVLTAVDVAGEDIPISTKGSMKKLVASLAQLLGSQIDAQELTYSEFIENFPDIADKLELKAYINKLNEQQARASKNEQQQVSKTQTTASRRSSPKEGSRGRGKSESPKTSPARKAKAQMEYGPSQYESSHYGRLRLPRFLDVQSKRQNWGREEYYQYMPYRMEWDPYTAGGRSVAAIPAPKPGGRNYYLRQQNDGRPVYRGVDRRLRGPNSVRGGGRPF